MWGGWAEGSRARVDRAAEQGKRGLSYCAGMMDASVGGMSDVGGGMDGPREVEHA